MHQCSLTAHCLENTPPFQDQGDGGSALDSDNVYLIPEYTFDCYGSVTQWGACVKNDTTITNIAFNVYRPYGIYLPGTSCYSLVGSNTLMRTVPDDSCITLAVPAQDQISVQPEDVVGLIFTPSSNPVEIDESIDTITVWHGPTSRLDSRNGTCAYRVGPDGNLDNTITGAPVITAMVGK